LLELITLKSIIIITIKTGQVIHWNKSSDYCKWLLLNLCCITQQTNSSKSFWSALHITCNVSNIMSWGKEPLILWNVIRLLVMSATETNIIVYHWWMEIFLTNEIRANKKPANWIFVIWSFEWSILWSEKNLHFQYY